MNIWNIRYDYEDIIPSNTKCENSESIDCIMKWTKLNSQYSASLGKKDNNKFLYGKYRLLVERPCNSLIAMTSTSF